ncbi:MAG: hypothetical protein IJJ33_04965 [Victivallales bacterium]|nr:hypothetical protein [Victivallales bacterium]
MTSFNQYSFANPPALFSPGFFWIWNDRLDVAELCAQLDDIFAHGFHSICIHPYPKGFRPLTAPSSMEPDYLTEEYLDILAAVMAHATSLGMNAWLYDEGGWPSGGACGKVRATNPDGFAARYYKPGPDGPVQVLASYDPHGDAQFPSIMEPGVTDCFLKLTHEAFLRKFGQLFGHGIQTTFTDEPGVPGFLSKTSVGWGSDFAEEFMRRKGYDLRPFLPQMLEMKPHTRRSRQALADYHDVRADLFIERFLSPIQQWCHAHGLLSGGHLNGEDEAEGNARYGYGHILRALRHLDVPGVDVIWRQLYPGGRVAPFPKYASSAAHQNGTRQVMVESFAIYGNGMFPEQMKWLVDFLMVRGINQFVFSSVSQKIVGNRMLGGPLMGSVQPQWDCMPAFATYIARCCAALSQGTPAIRTAVLFDIRAIWREGRDAHQALRRHYAVAEKLARHQQDYDFVDDDQLATAKIQRDGTLKISAMRYSTVILPSWKWMRPEASRTLERFAAVGGVVLRGLSTMCAPRVCRVSGQESSAIRACKRLCGAQALYFLVNESDREAKVRIALEEGEDIVFCDWESAQTFAVKSRSGHFSWVFPPFGSALFLTGAKPDFPVEQPPAGEILRLETGWTLRPLRRYQVGKATIETVVLKAAAKPAALGDWRSVLGETFSGHAQYAIEFQASKAGSALLDLGVVHHCCQVCLNGQTFPPRFFGPHRLKVRLRQGVNRLEVVVANSLANILGDEQVRADIYRRFPPVSPYESRLKVFDRDGHESGLFGPVTLQYQSSLGD